MSEMIERVAWAIEAEIDTVEMVMADPLTVRRLRAARITRVAIKAMQEPTEAMLDAVSATFDPGYGEWGANCHITEEAYQAMIAALSPSPKGEGDGR